MVDWPFPYDWRTPVVVSYQWLTHFSMGDSGKEFRQIGRTNPRWSLTARVLTRSPVQTGRLLRILAEQQGGDFAIIDPLEPAVRKQVRLLEDTKVRMLGAGVAEASPSFAPLPGLVPYSGSAWVGPDYAGRPILPQGFDWGADVGPTLGRDVTLVDFDIGVSSVSRHTTRHRRRYEGRILLQGVEIARMIGLAHHLNGAAGLLWLPAPEAVGALLGVDTVGSDTRLRIGSPYAAEEFLGDGMNRHLQVTQGAQTWRVEVRSVTQNSTESFMRLFGSQLVGYQPSQPAVARWLFAARFADDTLSFSLYTSSVAALSTAFVSIKE